MRGGEERLRLVDLWMRSFTRIIARSLKFRTHQTKRPPGCKVPTGLVQWRWVHMDFVIIAQNSKPIRSDNRNGIWRKVVASAVPSITEAPGEIEVPDKTEVQICTFNHYRFAQRSYWYAFQAPGLGSVYIQWRSLSNIVMFLVFHFDRFRTGAGSPVWWPGVRSYHQPQYHTLPVVPQQQ